MTISFRATSIWLALILSGLLLVGCGGSNDEPSAPAPSQAASEPDPAPEPEPEPEPAPEPEAEPAEETAAVETDTDVPPATELEPAQDAVTVNDDGVAEVTIGSTDQMQYTVRAFAVDAGQEVELTLVHEGQLPVEAMGHNVVILQAGEDYMAFGRAVMSGGGSLENEHLPESMRDGLVAYTSLIGGGESDTIRFTAPETPGEYPFLCTFPGHFGLMNGIMTVR